MAKHAPLTFEVKLGRFIVTVKPNVWDLISIDGPTTYIVEVKGGSVADYASGAVPYDEAMKTAFERLAAIKAYLQERGQSF